MKIIKFKKESNYSLNFVDKNNVFVGFDEDPQCCEEIGWCILDELRNVDNDLLEILSEFSMLESNGVDYPGFVFDKTFIMAGESNEGNYIIFKLKKRLCKKYLYLYNIQNGYYDHGFIFKDRDSIIKEGAV